MVIVAIGFCVRCTHCGVRSELLVGSYDVWDNSTTHHLLCERKDQNGKSGFGAARSTTAMGSSTTLHGVSPRLHSMYWAQSLQRREQRRSSQYAASSLIAASLSNSIHALHKNNNGVTMPTHDVLLHHYRKMPFTVSIRGCVLLSLM